MLIFVFREGPSLLGPWISCQRNDRPEDAAAIGLGSDFLIFPDDGRLEQNLIRRHVVADRRQMKRMK
jgi:hypothetical protein